MRSFCRFSFFSFAYVRPADESELVNVAGIRTQLSPCLFGLFANVTSHPAVVFLMRSLAQRHR